MAYSGSCHCGAVAFAVEADAPKSALSCNCSHCRRKGFLLAFVPAAEFTLTSGADKLREYTYNTHKIRHQFCTICGTQAFAFGKGQDGSDVRAINLRCVPGIELEKLELQPFDGASA